MLARMAKLVDAWDLKSPGVHTPCRFESCSGHDDAPVELLDRGVVFMHSRQRVPTVHSTGVPRL